MSSTPNVLMEDDMEQFSWSIFTKPITTVTGEIQKTATTVATGGPLISEDVLKDVGGQLTTAGEWVKKGGLGTQFGMPKPDIGNFFDKFKDLFKNPASLGGEAFGELFWGFLEGLFGVSRDVIKQYIRYTIYGIIGFAGLYILAQFT